jgi:CRISPR-associated protein Csb2
MGRHLLLTVRLHGDGEGIARYHGIHQGAPEWPPAPARVFQALVAGVARGNLLPESVVPALEWLERLDPPLIGAPVRTPGQRFSLFVPNNDADSLADPRDMSALRVKKAVHPSLFGGDEPFLYVWSLPEDAPLAQTIVQAANELYQLGRGVDMAWAVGEILDEADLQARLDEYRGVLHRPERGVQGDRMLPYPVAGSLASLLQRHRATKLRANGADRAVRTLFTNPPKPLFLRVSYARTRRQVVYELRHRTTDTPWPWALDRVVKLVESLRDGAAARLQRAMPDRAEEIERALVGRRPGGEHTAPLAQRVRIVPLPSIGSVHADRAVRRVLVEVPSGSPLGAVDVEWAFSGLEPADVVTGDLRPFVVVPSSGDTMLRHYLGPSRRWRTVTAVALPEKAKRRRIDPARLREEAKGGKERLEEESRAVAAVQQALRHAEIRARALAIRVQREPFDTRGARAEAFAPQTRFAKERLWHVEFELDRAVTGPLLIGDGRFLGLGLMAPVPEPQARVVSADERAESVAACQRTARVAELVQSGLFAFAIVEEAETKPELLVRALRRAVMARVQAVIGRAPLDSFFTGHSENGADSRSSRWNHLAYQWDPLGRRLLVIAPHVFEHRPPFPSEQRKLENLCEALDDFVELRAGTAGRFHLRRAPLDHNDPLCRPARSWTSLTPYVVTRHVRTASASDAVTADILAECDRSHLPRPHSRIFDVRGVPGIGLRGTVRLDFAVAISGPIALGRTRYLGGGLFAGNPC